MQDSAVINDQKRSSVEFNDKPEILSGRRQQDRHHIPSGGITVTQGGLMPGGRSACEYRRKDNLNFQNTHTYNHFASLVKPLSCVEKKLLKSLILYLNGRRSGFIILCI